MKIAMSLIVTLAMLNFAGSAMAVEYLAGVRGGWFIWEPFMQDIPEGQFSDVEPGAGALYGPVLGVTFAGDYSLAFSGLFGRQSSSWHYDTVFDASGNRYISGTSYLKADRYDFDTTLGYRIYGGLKVFLGYKYQHLDMNLLTTGRYTDASTFQVSVRDGDTDIEYVIHGPALGINYSMPLGENTYVSLSVSGISARGRLDITSGEVSYSGGTFQTAVDGDPRRDSQSLEMRLYGFNAEPSLGIRVGWPILSFGIRYQYLRMKFVDVENNGEDKIGWMSDQLYGMFVSVMVVM